MNAPDAYFHCRQCLRERPEGETPASWARISCGFNAEGIAIFCERHQLPVITFTFEGAGPKFEQFIADLRSSGGYTLIMQPAIAKPKGGA